MCWGLDQVIASLSPVREKAAANLENEFLYTCPECGGNLLLVSAAGEVWNVDPVTGELTWRQEELVRIFECRRCGELYKNVFDHRLPFRHVEQNWQVVAY